MGWTNKNYFSALSGFSQVRMCSSLLFLLAEFTARGIINVMRNILPALTNLQPLWQVKVVVFDIIYLFVQVTGHISGAYIKFPTNKAFIIPVQLFLLTGQTDYAN
jgi:hypothetical protein